MAFQRLDRNVAIDLALMVFGVVVALISFLAILALIFGIYVVVAESRGLPHPVSGIAVTFMLVMGVWNFMESIRLVNRPDHMSAMWIAIRSMLALCPVGAAVLFLA